MPKLFVYGTLKNPEIQKEVIGRTFDLEPISISGFKLSQIEIEGETYPALISGEDSVDGALIEVTPDELTKLDTYETKAYKRISVILPSGSEIFTYIKG